MKRLILSTSFLLGVGMMSFAQQNGTQVSPMKIYRMETTSNPEQKAELTKEQEIEQCKNLLNALDVKEAWIRSNPEELKVATESGWFEDAAATRAQLQARIKELESK
ncbi:MAG: hypothetical protein HYZ14_10725 [Bacteroidetes bacterium]|nr:hypothetical protein [Bacteroidota bacterium]